MHGTLKAALMSTAKNVTLINVNKTENKMTNINKPFCKVCTFLHNMLKDYFAPYLVTCSYGTDRLCWTLKEAESWIKYCGKNARIVGTYDYNIVIQRVQGV